MYLLIDNYDSFTYNLHHYFEEQGIKVLVKRNDKITINEIKKTNPEKIIISPGPKNPTDCGISCDVIKHFMKKIPILGVCLGNQCIAYVFGSKIVQSKKIMHGKTSLIYHDNSDLFKGIPSPFLAARYHSLIVKDVPDSLIVTSKTKDDTIMGLKHKAYPLWGIQFHPESFMTQYGKRIIKNFINI
jgi:anthranilate synthase/aminodeoxychorismate synthase-like glutamine amidotransferase